MIEVLQERTAEAGSAMQLSRQQMQESVGLARKRAAASTPSMVLSPRSPT